MAYTVNKTNSSATPNSYTVQDSILNTQTDIPFVGKGYAGYGEVIAENFLHLLENFSNTTAPTKPIKGQLWFDEFEGRLKVYNGSSFNPLGGAQYQSSAPASQTQGDLWIDSDTGQMYFYNGTTNVLVGPPSSTGTTNGFTFETIADSTDANQNITNLYNDGNRIAIISEDSFTPKSAIAGFATITKGINLSTAIAGLKFTGTATNADSLGGSAAANYLRGDSNDTTSGTLGILNDTGLTVGANNDLRFLIESAGPTIQSTQSDDDITFKVNDGGVTTTVMTIDGATSRIGIGNTSPTTKLDVTGTINATAITATEFTGIIHSTEINVLANGSIIFEGSTANDFETSLTVVDPTADRTITLPNITGTVITTGDTGTVTNTMLAGSITNDKITDSTIRAAKLNLSSDSVTVSTLSDSKGEIRTVPQLVKSTSYALISSDHGKHISTDSDITVNTGIFSVGQNITIFNNSSSSITITQGSGVTIYQTGTANTGSRTLAQKGLVTLLCVDTNKFVITGGGLS